MQQDNLTADVVYDSPVRAPIAAGEQLGELVITLEGMPEKRIPLVADRDVAVGGFMPRMRTAAAVIMGKITDAAANDTPADADVAAPPA
jgi:D-alanyl-D-alanine carboxypeptidase (penicillin-binding protein 5/6)